MMDIIGGCATSKDGTPIGYRTVGEGPGLVVLHGAMSSGYSHVELARELADAFTVHLPDRRGRGMSGPYRPDCGLADEIDDLAAVLRETGARMVFGVSSGAAIALRAALSLPEITRVAVYEPPVFPDPARPVAMLARMDAELADGRIAAALVTAMRGAKMGPPALSLFPRRLLERMTTMMMNAEVRRGVGENVPMRTLAPTLHYDFRIVADTSGGQEDLGGLDKPVRLIGGLKSPRYLREGLDILAGVLPDASVTRLPGLRHAAPCNVAMGGTPVPVARELRASLG